MGEQDYEEARWQPKLRVIVDQLIMQVQGVRGYDELSFMPDHTILRKEVPLDCNTDKKLTNNSSYLYP